MIRDAVEADIPAIMDMGRKFADDAGVTNKIGWHDATVESLLRVMIEGHVLLIGDRGMIGGFVFPHPLSGRMVFQELFWRSEGFEGVRLLAAAEKQAKAMGCERSLMIGIDTMPDVAGLYARLGYEPAERNFIKEL